MKSIKQICSTTFNTTPEKLWDLLINPEWTEKYMYNCKVISDFKIGSKIDWKGNFQGEEQFLTGEILELDWGKQIKYTIIDPALKDETKAENFSHITYEIKEQNGKQLLTVVNEIFEEDEEHLKQIIQGWEGYIFPTMQKCLEGSV